MAGDDTGERIVIRPDKGDREAIERAAGVRFSAEEWFWIRDYCEAYVSGSICAPDEPMNAEDVRQLKHLIRLAEEFIRLIGDMRGTLQSRIQAQHDPRPFSSLRPGERQDYLVSPVRILEWRDAAVALVESGRVQKKGQTRWDELALLRGIEHNFENAKGRLDPGSRQKASFSSLLDALNDHWLRRCSKPLRTAPGSAKKRLRRDRTKTTQTG